MEIVLCIKIIRKKNDLSKTNVYNMKIKNREQL